MKKILLSTFLLLCLNVFSADVLFTSGSISIADNTGCNVTSYTFTQTTPNTNAGKINLLASCVITFPAGVNLTSATMAGSTFKGSAILTGWSISGQVLTFDAPVGVGKNVSFNIVIANITNGASTSGNASVYVDNNGGDRDYYTTYGITTTACPSVPSNNNCGAPTVLTPPASGSSVCTTTNGTTFGATASPQTVCSGQADDDVWYRFTANNANHQVTVDGVAGFNTILEVMSGTCAGTLTSMACINATGSDGIETASLTGLTSGTQYFVRVYHNGAGAGVLAANSFTICVTSTAPAAGCAGLGTVLAAGSLPYTSGAQTTCGNGDNITLSNSTVCGSSLYYGGEDKTVSFTPSASGNVSINLTSSGSWLGMTLYAGCPKSGGTCVANAQSSAGNQSIGCAPVTAGVTYYLVIDSWPTPACNPFNVTISAPTGGTPAGTICANAVAMTMPFSASNQSTLCFGNDYSAVTGSSDNLYLTGEDKVYTFTTTGTECFSINLTNSSTSYIGYHVVQGCPGAGGTYVASGTYATGGVLSGSFTVPGAGTYFIIIDTYAAPSSVNYNIAVTSLGGGPSNDQPCNAQAVTLGTSVSGDNSCSSNAGEGALASTCFTGSLNTVWFSAVVPASGKLKLRATAGSLTNTQIQVFTGTCASLTYNNCNDNVAACSGFTSNDSELSLTGLTAGNTVWIRVDGAGSLTGTFSLLVIDGNNALSPIPGQDCGDPNPVCQAIMSVSNPGYSGFGNVCDLPTSYCLASGERNVVWYRVPISAAGTLNFDVVPNDFVHTSESETDYDFAIWEISDAGVVQATCAQIAAGTAPPDACNFSYLGVTGIGAAGNPPGSLPTTICPACPGGYNPSVTYAGAYETTINADVNDIYLIAVSNYISSSSGFRIRFSGTSTIDFAASLATAGGVTWSGGDVSTPTNWSDIDNWGGCVAPICGRDAFIAGFSNQPILTTTSGNSGTAIHTVKDLTIQAGATLTLLANTTLEICGNFTNLGSIIADPTSTVKFVGTAVGGQTVSGNFVGANKLGHVTVTKPAASGSVNLMNDIEMAGTFTTTDANSIFNSSNFLVTVGKHFYNFGGNSTFTNTGTTGTLEFNGTALQNYNQGNAQLDLNKVLLNNTAAAGSGVTLQTNMFIKATTGTLTLNTGTITTTGTSITTGFKVHVLNTTGTSVSTGTASSFVDGNLRRYMGSTGDFNFPLGNVAKGYQRAFVKMLTKTGLTYIDSRFDVWGTTCTVANIECTNDFGQATEDNGFWTLHPDAGTATYDMTLYPLNATNTTGKTAWTIIKRSSATAIDGTGWSLNGTCAGSSVSVVTRTGMSGFSFYGADQGVATLPIELISFTGQKEGVNNLLKWVTSSERDNDFFTLEKSQNGVDFTFLTEVDGAGNSMQTLNYQSYDYNPYQGITYYRLKQTNFDGQFTYSHIIALTNELEKISMSEVFPNPTSGNTSFDFFTPVKGSVHMKLFDNAGRLIYNKTVSVNNGNSNLEIDLEAVAKGAYSLEVKFDVTNFINIQKIIKN